MDRAEVIFENRHNLVPLGKASFTIILQSEMGTYSGIAIRKVHKTEEEVILRIANWYFNEWNTPIEKTVRRLTEQPNEDLLFQLILTFNGELAATAGLCYKVNLHDIHPQFKEYGPWIGLLYTHASYRNRGLGQNLLRQMEAQAAELHYSCIYLYTFIAENMYKSNGWQEIDRVPYKGHDTLVMKKELN
jgi:GNAT superfamily N-acetyltransferase